MQPTKKRIKQFALLYFKLKTEFDIEFIYFWSLRQQNALFKLAFVFLQENAEKR